MKNQYGQYCPVALASEILGERWTILVILALCDGVTRFSDMQRALPRISASTLAQRLRSLEASQVISKRKTADRKTIEYRLTAAGQDLAPIIFEMGSWGQRWARDLEKEDLDPRFLIWSVHLRMNIDAMPPGRTTIQFEFTDLPHNERYYWIVVNGRTVDVCVKHPGYDADVQVASNIGRFVDAWRGFSSMHNEIAAGRIKISGAAELTAAFPRWLLLSALAHVKRQRRGRERTMQQRTERLETTH